MAKHFDKELTNLDLYINRLSEFQKAESGIGQNGTWYSGGNLSKGVPESRMIYGLECREYITFTGRYLYEHKRNHFSTRR